MSGVQTARPITRDDIEAKLRELQGGADAGAEAARGAGLAAIIAGALLAMLLAYLVGRRVGKKRRAVVEIRRF